MEAILFDFLSNTFLFRPVKKGKILLKKDKSKDSYVVLKGGIRTCYVKDSEEKTTAFYTEMDVLTPPCVISKTPSRYYVSCIEDSILTVSNSDMEAEVNSKFPKFEILCRLLAEDLLAKQQIDFDAFKTSSPEQRYLNSCNQGPTLFNVYHSINWRATWASHPNRSAG